MEYLTVSQAAGELGLTARAVRNRIERGELAAVRMSARLLLIPAAEVERQKAIGRLKPGPKPGRRGAGETR
jgi:excisionase family DNA binding protein